MARMAMDSTWKRLVVFISFCSVSEIKSADLASFFFQNSFEFVSLVAWKQFIHEQGTSI